MSNNKLLLLLILLTWELIEFFEKMDLDRSQILLFQGKRFWLVNFCDSSKISKVLFETRVKSNFEVYRKPEVCGG